MSKNEVLCQYLKNTITNYEIKAEYSTNSKDVNVITVQEQAGQKIVFYGDCDPLFNYYEIVIYGETIRSQKTTANSIGALIGQSIKVTIGTEIYQIIFMQLSNPQTIEYQDIRRVGYQMILKTIISKIN